MLVEPNRTPYDLNFRLFGFRVRVHPLFWLLAALLGSNTLELGIQFMLIWVAVAFVSILVHELGHAFAFRLFGSDSHVVLYAFGGLAVPYSAVSGRGRRILVSLAGPFAGFLLCGAVYGSNQATGWVARANQIEIAVLYAMLITVNLYWGIFNLLPVFPLDGGQVCREVCGWFSRGQGLQLSLKISVGVAVVVAVYSLGCELERRSGGGPIHDFLPGWFPRGSVFTGILFAILAVQSYQLLQQIGRGAYYEGPDDRVPWER